MKTILHAVTGRNRYCGPTAIATILGITTDEASRLIRVQSGKPAVRGVMVHDMHRTLLAAGCRVTYSGRVPKVDQPTFAQWLRTQPRPMDKHVIVVHGHHYGTLLGNRFLCSLTHRHTVGLKDIPKRRARVTGWLVVHSLPQAAPVVAELPRRPDTERSARQRAKALAAKWGIEIEKDGASVVVWGQRAVCDTEADPYDGDHYASDWSDALERVETYAALAAQGSIKEHQKAHAD